MAEQIECVGGPEYIDGSFVNRGGLVIEFRQAPRLHVKTEVIGGDKYPLGHYQDYGIYHIYHYNPTTNTYEYKGVRK